MPEVPRQNCQLVLPRGRRDNDIRKTRRMTPSSRPVCNRTGQSGDRCVKNQDTLAVQMQNGLKP